MKRTETPNPLPLHKQWLYDMQVPGALIYTEENIMLMAALRFTMALN